jgi:hypothetical protein
VQLSKFLIHVRSSLWFVPVLCVLAGVLLSSGTIALDRYFDYQALPGALVVRPDAAVVRARHKADLPARRPVS